MITRPYFRDKKILLIDRDKKNKNDRTWCFWEKEPGFFQPIVFHEWKKLWFHGEGYDALNDISPYSYKLIRGIDFYEHCFELIRQAPNVTVRFGPIDHIVSTEAGTWIETGGEQIFSEYVFSSIVPQHTRENEKEISLLQHFKGWLIETSTPVFDPLAATLMDFRVPQTNGTTFVYVMPFSPTTALIEYTLFSPSLLDAEVYDEGLSDYITRILKVSDYQVREEEVGQIPMTTRVFPEKLNNIIYLGTAGGQTKPSSGYTFNFIQRHSDRLIDSLEKTGKPTAGTNLHHKRFRLYDHTLLNILANQKMEGEKIFTGLFSNNRITEVLQFLDNETSLSQELRLVSALPTRLFLRAALREL